MPPVRRARSPRPLKACSPRRVRLPKYKRLARDDGVVTETQPTHRYAPAHPDDSAELPCHTWTEEELAAHEVKGSRCYAPTQHSARRQTCRYLIPPDAGQPMSFPPGLHLYGHGHLRGRPPLRCTATDMIMFDMHDVDTTIGGNGERPALYSFVVLGPFVHPVTHRLAIKCVQTEALVHANNINDLGMLFATPDQSERGVMVPTPSMLSGLVDRLHDATWETTSEERGLLQLAHKLHQIATPLYRKYSVQLELQEACEESEALRATLRVILRGFYEAALYYRRWAGPGRKVPVLLLDGVGTGRNPLSAALRGKYVTPSARGARVGATGNEPADFVAEPEGTLTSMSQAHTRSVEMAFRTLPIKHMALLRDAFELGTPFRMIDGSGFWLSTTDPNVYNGNPSHMRIDLFDMCFGTPNGQFGFRAGSSVNGTATYCVQIAAIQIVRTVQTLLPCAYRTSPAWALADGEFDNVHT